ncbi:hypothetical protein RS130_20195 [Paraglaciecola aquimarina]|uniref:Uncharacterized protein n=1 Tax=Paraglaciecola aquimarina TaxID=1235557 RepID=A0ABU3T0V7_9ALTE|nr:hypothetical protein [Paraglaciecola aquimarina]MDU0355899.1 hypothetical protein [Paraglaciecola aquimarina]
MSPPYIILVLYGLLSVLLSWPYSVVAAAENNNTITVDMGIYQGIYLKYPQHLDKNLCQTARQFATEQIDRPLAEVTIICEAVSASGYTLNIIAHPVPNDQKSTQLC